MEHGKARSSCQRFLSAVKFKRTLVASLVVPCCWEVIPVASRPILTACNAPQAANHPSARTGRVDSPPCRKKLGDIGRLSKCVALVGPCGSAVGVASIRQQFQIRIAPYDQLSLLQPLALQFLIFLQDLERVVKSPLGLASLLLL